MKLVVLGRSITAASLNSHASFYRGLLRDFASRGHTVCFIQHDSPPESCSADMREVEGVNLNRYSTLDELKHYHTGDVREADAVIVCSSIEHPIAVGEWVTENASGVTAIHDTDTPGTVAALRRGESPATVTRELIAKYHIYLSSTGGSTLAQLEKNWRAPSARTLYFAADATTYFPEYHPAIWDLGYAGTYFLNREAAVERLVMTVASRSPDLRFVMTGPDFPAHLAAPANVERLLPAAPVHQRRLYGQQRFALHLSQTDMLLAGWSPTVRLFEAAACGKPVITDCWSGVDEFFKPGREILLATSAGDVLRILRELNDDDARSIGYAARRRVLSSHTTEHRAMELETILHQAGVSWFGPSVGAMPWSMAPP